MHDDMYIKCSVIELTVPLAADCQEHPVHANPIEPGPLQRGCAWHLLAASIGHIAGTTTICYHILICNNT